MAQYMGPTTSVAHILQELTIIFGNVASFEVLMQNFYKGMQGNHEKVPPSPWGWKGPLVKLDCNALGG